MIRHIRHIRTALCVLVLAFLEQNAQAGVTANKELNFGEFIVKNNDAVHSITVNISGPSYTYDTAGFIVINDANIQNGDYDIDSLPPNTNIASVTVTQITPLSGPSGPNFQMNTFQVSHSNRTSPAGVARVRVGATAQTSGTGTAYVDQTYTGTLQIQINF